MLICLLAAAGAGGGGPSAWLGFDDFFWLSMLLLLVVAAVTALVRLRQKDKCLKLVDDYHVTYLTSDGRAMWGDLTVSSNGLELRFDAPYRTRRGLSKSSSLIFPDELGKCLAICRTAHGLTDDERRDREEQIRRSFAPGLARRGLRWLRNVVNTIRDAVAKAVGMMAGQVGKQMPAGTVIKSQKGGIDELGKSLVGAAGNAYEPILERYIGRPVILELAGTAESKTACELPGYLVDYSERFVAVFNVSHDPLETIELEVTDSIAREGVEVKRLADKVVVTCCGEDPLVVRRMRSGDHGTDLSIVLLPGSSVRLPAPSGRAVVLELERTRQIDIVCPRAVARIR